VAGVVLGVAVVVVGPSVPGVVVPGAVVPGAVPSVPEPFDRSPHAASRIPTIGVTATAAIRLRRVRRAPEASEAVEVVGFTGAFTGAFMRVRRPDEGLRFPARAARTPATVPTHFSTVVTCDDAARSAPRAASLLAGTITRVRGSPRSFTQRSH